MDYSTGEISITDETHSIHHYTASWQSPYSKFKKQIQMILGKNLTEKIQIIKSYITNR